MREVSSFYKLLFVQSSVSVFLIITGVAVHADAGRRWFHIIHEPLEVYEPSASKTTHVVFSEGDNAHVKTQPDSNLLQQI